MYSVCIYTCIVYIYTHLYNPTCVYASYIYISRHFSKFYDDEFTIKIHKSPNQRAMPYANIGHLFKVVSVQLHPGRAMDAGSQHKNRLPCKLLLSITPPLPW